MYGYCREQISRYHCHLFTSVPKNCVIYQLYQSAETFSSFFLHLFLYICIFVFMTHTYMYIHTQLCKKCHISFLKMEKVLPSVPIAVGGGEFSPFLYWGFLSEQVKRAQNSVCNNTFKESLFIFSSHYLTYICMVLNIVVQLILGQAWFWESLLSLETLDQLSLGCHETIALSF